MANSETNHPLLSDDDRRVMAGWAAACAARALPLFEAAVPDDPRPRLAIDGKRAYAAGALRSVRLRALSWAALAAGREAADPAAEAAARAAGCAAATAFTHALASSHQIRHLLSPAVRQAVARERAAGDDPAVGNAALAWALGHAPTAVREAARRLPPARHGRSRAGVLAHRLQTGLRD